MNNTAPKILTDWANSISTRNPNVMTNFYTDNSILLATYEDLCVCIDEIYKYFIEFLDKKDLRCELLENYNQNDVNANILISSGIYRFSFKNEYGELVVVFARYSYVFRNDKIINHHSSLVPSSNS